MGSRVRHRMHRRGFWRRRPRLAAGLGAAALTVAAAGGWLAYSHDLSARPMAPTANGPSPSRPKVAAPPAPQALQEKLATLAASYHEPVGIAVTDVTARWTAQAAGEEVFPQQSVSKLWVALSVMHAVDRGALTLDRQVVLTPDDRSVFYQPLASRIRGSKGYVTTIDDLLRRQLTLSDNAANDKLVRELGGGAVVDRTLAEKRLAGLGVGETEREMQTRAAGLTWRPEYGQTWIFKQARDRLPDAVRDAALNQYLADPPDGAKPAAITESLAALKRGELLSARSTAYMLDLMAQCRTGGARLRAGLPRDWSIAHKTGTGPDWRGASVGINDVGVITAPDGRSFAVAVMMRETTKPFSARRAFMQKVARAVVDYWRSGPASLTIPDRQMAGAAPAAESAR